MFDGYQEELPTKDGAHESRTGGRAGPTEDFTRDMIMKSNKEDLLSNKDNKQRFIKMQVKAWNILHAKHVMPRVIQMS